MLCAPNPIATPTTPALASSGARLMPRSPRMTTLAIEKMVIDAMLRKIEPRARTRCLRRSSTRARSACAAALLIAPGLGPAGRVRHGAPGRRRAQGGGVVPARLRRCLAPPPSLCQPRGRAPGRRRAVAQLRKEGVRRPLGQPVDHPVHDRLDDEREDDDEDHAQQQVDRPGEKFAAYGRGVPVVGKVPDELAGQTRIGAAAAEQRVGPGMRTAEHRHLDASHHTDPPVTQSELRVSRRGYRARCARGACIGRRLSPPAVTTPLAPSA